MLRCIVADSLGPARAVLEIATKILNGSELKKPLVMEKKVSLGLAVGDLRALALCIVTLGMYVHVHVYAEGLNLGILNYDR